MHTLFVSAKVQARIAELQKAGKAGQTVARKAAMIINSFCRPRGKGGSESFHSTRYGEKRIKNCRKYDLGCGYRLITLMRGHQLMVLFLGTHDECQRWLDKNSPLKKSPAGKGRFLQLTVRGRNLPPEPGNGCSQEQKDQGFDTAEPDQQSLRKIFSGLVNASY